MKNTYIYILKDPIDNSIRYVGKSNDPKRRLYHHCSPSRFKNTHKCNWIKLLKRNGLRPLLEVIEEVPVSVWKIREKFWIKYYIELGFDLTNTTTGGDGLSFGNSTSFKKGNNSWNEGTANIKKCKACGAKYKSAKSYNKYSCSKKCSKVIYSKSENSGKFNKGKKPWNTGLKGLKLKPNKNVHQYTKDKNTFIKTWATAKKASLDLKINEEGIGQCARGKSKSSGGYWWTYKKQNNNE
jgi:hypothetical protein